MNKKYLFTAVWMFISVVVIYFVLDKLVLTPIINWITTYFGW